MEAALTFAELLYSLIQRSGLSNNELARIVEVDPSYISRLTTGSRDPPRCRVVQRIAEALNLSVSETDRLRVAAGYSPRSIEMLGRWDSTLEAVATVLINWDPADPQLALYRQVIEAVSARWNR